jgi:hypothetical protein
VTKLYVKCRSDKTQRDKYYCSLGIDLSHCIFMISMQKKRGRGGNETVFA